MAVVPEGIKMADGDVLAVDAIICATGFDTSFRPTFPVIRLGGRNLRDVWAEEPTSYFCIAAAGFPNYVSQYLYPAKSSSVTLQSSLVRIFLWQIVLSCRALK